jgi:hypothetical protein
VSYYWSAEPDNGSIPDLIPPELPDAVMLALVMVDPRVMSPDAGADLRPDQEVGGGLQMRLNCQLPAAIAGLRAALGALETALAAEVAARADRN